MGTSTATKREGVVYVMNPELIQETDITSEKLHAFRSTVIGRGLATKQRNLVFGSEPKLEILDGDNNVDEKVQTRIHRMLWAPAVDLPTKMIQAFDDVFFQGAGLYNWVWKYHGNEYFLEELNHLPAHSFANPPNYNLFDNNYCKILHGIRPGKDGKLEFYQTVEDGRLFVEPTQLDGDNIFMVTDPASPSIVSDPIIYPLAPIIEMWLYTWNSAMQQVNRIGSPVLFIKISNPEGPHQGNGYISDVEFAEMIMASWGKDMHFPLRENMDIVKYDVREGKINLEVINALNSVIIDYLSPSSFVSKDGTLIGGSSLPEHRLIQAYIRGIHHWLCGCFSKIVNKYLEANGWTAKGYTGRVFMDIISPEEGELNLNRAKVGVDAEVLFPNEVRSLLGFEGVDDKEIARLKEYYKTRSTTTTNSTSAETNQENATPLSTVKEVLVSQTEAKIAEAADELADQALKSLGLL